MPIKCVLKPVENSLPELILQNGKTVTLGRSVEMKIENKRCSKKQVEVIADYQNKLVKVKQLGPNHSGINGAILGMGESGKALNGDVLEVLLGELKYKIVFEGDEEPVRKIPKMFLPKAEQFKKDELLEKGTWEVKGNNEVLVYVFGESMKDPKSKVAAFDLDGTIISTKSGNVFPKDLNDWKFQYPSIPDKLKDFLNRNSDFKIIIITNQAGCKTEADIKNMKKKTENVTSAIGVPVLVFIAPDKNKYRKPLTGSWDLFVEEYNKGMVPELKESFYCGDAAGRKKDHASSDRFFALNIGITFKLPEQFFLGSVQNPEFTEPAFNPQKYLAKALNNDHVKFENKQEMIIMVGYPGSGKSSYVKNVILPRNFRHVNRDTLKTPAKCLQVAESALQSNESVVIDNTSPEKKDRTTYINLAKKYNVPVRCFKMNVDHSHAFHNAKFRELTSGTGVSVPDVAFNSFKARYQEPVVEEGYTEIVTVNFVPNFDDFPDSEKQYRLKLYGSFLREK